MKEDMRIMGRAFVLGFSLALVFLSLAAILGGAVLVFNWISTLGG